MKTIIQLAILALIGIAAFQIGRYAWTYFEFQDAVQNAVVHGEEKTTADLRRKILKLARDRDVHLEWDDVDISVQGNLVSVNLSYFEEVPVEPFYKYPYTFVISASSLRPNPPRVDDQR